MFLHAHILVHTDNNKYSDQQLAAVTAVSAANKYHHIIPELIRYKSKGLVLATDVLTNHNTMFNI